MKKVLLISCVFILLHSCDFGDKGNPEVLESVEFDSNSREWMSTLSRYRVLTEDSILPQFSYQLDDLSGKYYSINLRTTATYDVRQEEGKYYVCVFNDWRFSFLSGGPEFLDHYIEIPESYINLFHQYDDIELIYEIERGRPNDVYFEGNLTAKYSFYGKIKAIKYKFGNSEEISIIEG